MCPCENAVDKEFAATWGGLRDDNGYNISQAVNIYVNDVIVCTCLPLGREHNRLLFLDNGIEVNFPFSTFSILELLMFYADYLNDVYLQQLSLNYSDFGLCCPFSKHTVFL